MTIMNLNDLSKEAFSIAKANGWHDEEHSDEHFLMLIITEIVEAVQADRKDKHADVSRFKECQTYYNSFLPPEEIRTIRFREDFEEYIKNSVEDEFADIVIRCLDLAGLRGIDLSPVQDVKESLLSLKDKQFISFCYRLCEMSTYGRYSTEEKLTTIITSVLRYCELTGIDIGWFITQKMKYNRLRGYHHGGKKY